MGMTSSHPSDVEYSICSACTDEVPEDEIGMCTACGMDGLCVKCMPHEEHEDLVDDGK